MPTVVTDDLELSLEDIEQILAFESDETTPVSELNRAGFTGPIRRR